MTARDEAPQALPLADPLDLGATYSVNAKALRRWTIERLTMRQGDDGTINARFRYEGSTCSNMGRALAFEYHVRLAPRDAQYALLELRCTPVSGDDGYAFMCRYRIAGGGLMSEIEQEQPLLGRPLNTVLTWDRARIGPACYCEAESRDHKWGLVLETIHFALAQQERQRADADTLHHAQDR